MATRKERGLRHWAGRTSTLRTLLLLSVVTLCLLIFTQCKGPEAVADTKVEYKTEYKDRLIKDTIYERTDNYIFSAGDTVYIDRYSYKYRERLVRDTILVNHVDSIYVEHTEYIEKPLKDWQKGLMTVGLLAIVGLIALIMKKLK